MKFFLISVLILSGLVFAKPTVQAQKKSEDAGESVGINLSFSREVNHNNIKQKCMAGIKRLFPGVMRTPEVENIALEHCISEWKSLQ